jgi:hypothetical protein
MMRRGKGSTADYPHIPGVTTHAQQRQHERYGSQWSRDTWLGIVMQIIERRAALVAIRHPTREDPVGCELWLVNTPDGDVRVSWRPNSAVITTILAPEHSTAHYARHVLGMQRIHANHSAENTNRFGRQRADREWRRAVRQDDDA